MPISEKDFEPLEGVDDSAPSHNPPWPYLDAFAQGRFERRFLADGETINFDALPKQQSWASFFGMSDQIRIMLVLSRVTSSATSAHRPLTGAEATAIGEHTVTSLHYFAWAQPVTLAIAVAATTRGKRTFRFPLYRPKMVRFSPFSFPTKRMPLVSGPRAVSMWHAVRLLAYVTIAWIPSTLFFGSIADTTYQAHCVRDPRLAAMVGDIRRNSKHQHDIIRQQLGVVRPAETATHQNQQPSDTRADPDSQAPQDYSSADYTTQENSTLDRPSTNTAAPQTTHPNWPRRTPTQPPPRRAQGTASPESGSRRNDDHSDDFDDDDASPVSPSATAGQGSSGSSGSAWDRIRQQAASGSSDWGRGDSSGQEQSWGQLRQDKTRNPKDYAPKTDSYSYSNDDEERERRNYEKEQAQKEFDALLEAERRGEGSSGGGRSQRR
ncbi:hypothetical protein F4802DRAFT_572233 [Xylaria palmicola]|nr:hypothetical protein F4802DRAFT_572233 [Xylaria palmicola]